MRVTGAVLGVAAALCSVAPAAPAQAAGLDVALVEGSFGFTPGLGLLAQPAVELTFSGACPTFGPTYADVPGDSEAVTASQCGPFSMTGTLLNGACGFGLGSGTFSLVEPDGEAVTGSFVIVIEGALAVVLVPSYSDDGGAGPGAGLLELTLPVVSSPPPSGTCVTGLHSVPGTGLFAGAHL